MASIEQEKVRDNEEEIRGKRSRILRIAGEFPSRRELHEMELVAEKENMEAQEIVALLTELSVKTGMPITQENGQRCFGPPRDWHGPTPPKGCEVFVGKLPRDIFEPHLVPLFSTAGDIFQIRLMMDFSGTNRGYCFVQYKTPEEAKKAIRELNNYEVSPGRRIGVLKSVDNCRLFIGNVPKDKSEEEILEEISRHTEGVKRVIAYPSAEDKTKNRGFAFVEYDSHKAAAMARRKLIPGNILPWGHDVCVDWAEPEPEVDPEIMNKVQNLYVRNLMLSTTEERLRKIFNEVSSNGVEKVKKIKDYAFVHFSSREKADAARMALNKTDIDGATVEISWAKPAERSTDKAPRQWRQNSPQGNSSPTSSGSFRGRRRDGGRMHFGPTSPGAYPFLPVSPVMDPYLMYGYPSPIPISGIQTGYRKTVESPMEIFPNYYRPGGLSDPTYYHDAVAHKSMMFHANYATEY